MKRSGMAIRWTVIPLVSLGLFLASCDDAGLDRELTGDTEERDTLPSMAEARQRVDALGERVQAGWEELQMTTYEGRQEVADVFSDELTAARVRLEELERSAEAAGDRVQAQTREALNEASINLDEMTRRMERIGDLAEGEWDEFRADLLVRWQNLTRNLHQAAEDLD